MRAFATERGKVLLSYGAMPAWFGRHAERLRCRKTRRRPAAMCTLRTFPFAGRARKIADVRAVTAT
jgi:hypothetical protein